MSEIHIVSAIDKEYLQHFCVMVTSLAENHDKKSSQLCLHLLHNNLNAKDLQYIEDLTNKNSILLSVYFINNVILKGFRVNQHLTLATYYRVLISELLDNKIDKVIYLDSDIILKQDILDLWMFNIENFAIGAVIDIYGEDRMLDLNISNSNGYFNAGILVMNLKKWRNERLGEKVIQYINENMDKLTYLDQDALNAVLYKDWTPIPAKWNVQSNMFNVNSVIRYLSLKELRKAINEPAIIHYTSASKPWHVTNEHYYKNEYYEYLKKTVFSNFMALKKQTSQLVNNKSLLFIFGAGELGVKLKQSINCEIEGFIDNNSSKWNTKIEGIQVFSPDVIKNFHVHQIGVIVASVHYKEISKQLSTYGLREERDFIHQL